MDVGPILCVTEQITKKAIPILERGLPELVGGGRHCEEYSHLLLRTKLRGYFMRQHGTHLAPKLNQFDAAKDDILAIFHPLSSPLLSLVVDELSFPFIDAAERLNNIHRTCFF